MSWSDHYRRVAAIEAVLNRAHETGQTVLPYQEIPEAVSVFESKDALLLALHAKWSTLYIGRLEHEMFIAETSGTDSSKATAAAWTGAAALQTTLRRLLDNNELPRAERSHPGSSQAVSTLTAPLRSSAYTPDRAA